MRVGASSYCRRIRHRRRVTNVRDDRILESKFWRTSFEERRCLVPASSFCEPNGDVKPATWHGSRSPARRAATVCVSGDLAAIHRAGEESLAPRSTLKRIRS